MTSSLSTPLRASVVVPSYKGQDKLPTLLRALEQQDAQRDTWEAVIVIDGVFDDSPALVEAAAQEGLPVRSVILEENQGRVGALNAGFAAAEGHVLIRCDDDLEPRPSYIRDHIARHASTNRPVGVVGLTIDVLPEGPYTRAYGHSRTRAGLTASYRGDIPAWRHWAANCSVTRETYNRLGGYSEAYTHYGWEDVDFGYRLTEAGIEVLIAPELETIHHGAAVSTLTRTKRAFLSGAARQTFDALHPGAMPAPQQSGGWWNTLVSRTAETATLANVDSRARAVDAALPYLPRRMAEKLIALSVESASIAGYANAHESLVGDF